MTRKTLLLIALGLSLAACEKEKGAGFTGIGPSASMSLVPAYGLDFPGLTQDN